MRMIAILCSLMLLCGCSGGVEILVSREISAAYLWSMARGGTVHIKDDYILRGFVTMNDYLGETRRSVIISDHSSGVEIKIDMDNIHQLLPFGSEVEVYCSGLYIGRESNTLVMGTRPTAEFAVDRIPAEDVSRYIRVVGEAAPNAERMAIADIGNEDIFRYVMIEGVRVIDEERDCRWCDVDMLTGEYCETARHFTDGRDTLTIVTSPTADYCSDHILKGPIHCIGVIDVFRSNLSLRLSNYQIVPAE